MKLVVCHQTSEVRITLPMAPLTGSVEQRLEKVHHLSLTDIEPLVARPKETVDYMHSLRV